MATPTIANRKGYYYEIKAGERYLWCACGLSATQPFCDGSHKGTEFRPVAFRATQDEDVIFCGCKQTKTGPFCDGTHSNLTGYGGDDDPDSESNRKIALAEPGTSPRIDLDGECYVFSTVRAELAQKGNLAYCPVISPSLGALFQSQFYLEAGPGTSPVISADGRETVLFITEGDIEVEISGHRLTAEARSGLYIRPDEAFRLHNAGARPAKLFLSNGPGSEDLAWRETMQGGFDGDLPNRLAEIDPSQRHAMAARFYQLLVNRDHGSTVMTQFIGNIPPSKAEPHRHLYEEALIILSGEGVVWTERTKARVAAGDVLFLPRKQTHSVQCLSESGIEVVGVIYPGDNPSINY